MFGKKKKKKGEAEAEEGAETEEADAKPEAEKGEEGGEAAEGEEGGEGHAPKKSKKKLIIIAVAAIVVLGGAGAGLYFSGMLGHKDKGGDSASAEPEKGEPGPTIPGPDGKPIPKPIFYTLPDFLVNLNSQGKAASFLKATVVIEVARPTDVPLIEANLPRISDAFTTYLRELRPSDLAGSAGIQRLREELVVRVNKAIAPVKVNDVLFKDIVVQ